MHQKELIEKIKPAFAKVWDNPKMPSTTTYSFGDVVLVPFPFTDQSATQKRPAVVVISDAYNRARPDIILMAITGHLSAYPRIGSCRFWMARSWPAQGFDYQADSRHNRKWSNPANVWQARTV